MNINFNLGQRYRYPSRRSVVFGNRGMVATASQLAAGAGMDMLKAGGNAVDAAIATAICLTVVEPVSNGIGSDAFAIIWMKDHLYGLNSSGFAPGAISADIVRGMGHTEMPIRAGFPSPCRARCRMERTLPPLRAPSLQETLRTGHRIRQVRLCHFALRCSRVGAGEESPFRLCRRSCLFRLVRYLP